MRREGVRALRGRPRSAFARRESATFRSGFAPTADRQTSVAIASGHCSSPVGSTRRDARHESRCVLPSALRRRLAGLSRSIANSYRECSILPQSIKRISDRCVIIGEAHSHAHLDYTVLRTIEKEVYQVRRQAMIRAFISLFCGCIGVFRFGVVADSRLKPIEQVQESRIPDTPVGHHLAGWLKAYDSGDIEVVRRFVAEHYDKTHFQNGPNPVNFFFSSLYPETGSLVFNRVLYANEHKIIALVQSALTEAWYRLIIR